MKTDRYKNHNIEAVVDKLVVKEEDEERIRKSVATAMKQGDGMVMVLEKGAGEAKTYQASHGPCNGYRLPGSSS